jgi:hypothetical protein
MRMRDEKGIDDDIAAFDGESSYRRSPDASSSTWLSVAFAMRSGGELAGPSASRT